MEQRYLTTHGLVLKHLSLGESDRRIVLLVPGVGKIIAKARGAKNLNSPFNGRLMPANICNLLLYRTPGGSWTITQCQTIETFGSLKQDLLKASLALAVLDIVDRCTEMETPSDELFALTKIFLETIDSSQHQEKQEKTELLFLAYQIQILDILGILPSFTECVRCHKKVSIETLPGWHPLEMLCEICLHQSSQIAYELYENNYLKLLNFLRGRHLADSIKVKLSTAEQYTLKTILQTLWGAQSFSIPKSLGVLETLRA